MERNSRHGQDRNRLTEVESLSIIDRGYGYIYAQDTRRICLIYRRSLHKAREIMVRDLIIQKKNGQRIYGRVYLPENGKATYPAVIFAHGFASNYRDIEHYGPQFAEAGVAMIVFDFCGGGPETYSDGDMEHMSVLTEMEDLLAVISQVREMDDIDAEALFLMGESQGGYVAALTAGRYPELVRGLILWYPAFVIEEIAKEEITTGVPIVYRIFGLTIGEIYNRDATSLHIYQEIGRYHGNVLILHGNRDHLVPLSYSQKALKVYRNASLNVIHGAGHGFHGEDSRMAGELSIEFVRENLSESR